MICFHKAEIEFHLKRTRERKKWLNEIIKQEGKVTRQIDIIFCSDRYLLEINKKHLKHNYFTDIITFNYTENEDFIAGDLYISIERIIENAQKYKIPFERELDRIMVHGLLHLMGYNDKSKKEASVIHEKEDYYLSKSL